MTSTSVRAVEGVRLRRRVLVAGVVQGVGFRPYVYALARELGLTGSARNTAEGVVAEVEGDGWAVTEFCRRVGPDAPALAIVTAVSWSDEPARGDGAFVIEASRAGSGRTFVPPDVAICDDCLQDLTDPRNRRYRHPFVTCTNCGPRFTIIRELPYDRATTTMAGFPLCAECACEYGDPANRRFHAEPICCPRCGPRLFLFRPGRARTVGERALADARRLLRQGAVLAVKGIGGYHLACDATSEAAVALLRSRKRRERKPFAVMVGDLETASAIAEVGPQERNVLLARERSIVLLRRRRDDGALPLAELVAPGILDVGLMVAYTPLHHLLLGLPGDEPGPPALVMTSGNVTKEPLAIGDDEARDRLADLADAWLMSDRPIHVPCDDSVVRILDGAELPVRRSRGYAPLPVRLPFAVAPMLAVGGDLKNTFCLATGNSAWLSAHVGDMDDLLTQQGFERAACHLEGLTGVQPLAVIADCHPGYRSHQWARRNAGDRPVHFVQHHHAHVAATMAEYGHDGSRRVLGVAFDGTGYGTDGAAWGGEFLLADYDGFTRAAHLGYVLLPGADAGVRNPCRMALSQLRAAGVPWDTALPCVKACSGDELRILDTQLDKAIGCVPTSSVGRLFDAVASITGICHRAEHEAQAASELEAAARSAADDDDERYGFLLSGNGDFPWRVDASPVIAAAARDVLEGKSAATVALRFHRGLADVVVRVAEGVRAVTGTAEVTLSGGAFVNTLLSRWCAQALTDQGFLVLRHRYVPPTDAGLALGQIAVAAHQLPLAGEPGGQHNGPMKEGTCA